MMRSLLLTFPILITCLASTALTQASPFTKPEPHLQAPMIHQAPGIVLPGSPSSNGNDNDDGPSPGGIIISDVLGRDRSISIFASLSRDVDSVAARLQNGRLNATVLAPLNAEIAKLPRKPWEDAEEYSVLGADAYEGPDGEGRAQRNLKKFVEAHVIEQSPLVACEKTEAMAGNKVWMEEKDGRKFVQPGNFEVLSVADKVSNGEVWILKGVLNYAS